MAKFFFIQRLKDSFKVSKPHPLITSSPMVVWRSLSASKLFWKVRFGKLFWTPETELGFGLNWNEMTLNQFILCFRLKYIGAFRHIVHLILSVSLISVEKVLVLFDWKRNPFLYIFNCKLLWSKLFKSYGHYSVQLSKIHNTNSYDSETPV